MNVFRKQFFNFSKSCLDSMPQPELVILSCKAVATFRIAFAGNKQFDFLFREQIIFPFVFCISGIGGNLRALTKIQRQLCQALQIRTRAREDCKLDREIIDRRNDLNFDTKEITAFAGYFPRYFSLSKIFLVKRLRPIRILSQIEIGNESITYRLS